jgi:hypothetical protein
VKQFRDKRHCFAVDIVWCKWCFVLMLDLFRGEVAVCVMHYYVLCIVAYSAIITHCDVLQVGCVHKYNLVFVKNVFVSVEEMQRCLW